MSLPLYRLPKSETQIVVMFAVNVSTSDSGNNVTDYRGKVWGGKQNKDLVVWVWWETSSGWDQKVSKISILSQLFFIV